MSGPMRIRVNGETHQMDVDPSTPLLYVLRDELRLNGARYGCGLGQCGACTVLLDAAPVFSCITPVGAVGERAVRTLEGLLEAGKPGRLQSAFIAEQAAQCGYCIPGMVMRAQALLEREPSPSGRLIRAELQPHLCRCGTHLRIVRAVQRAARAGGGGKTTPEGASPESRGSGTAGSG